MMDVILVWSVQLDFQGIGEFSRVGTCGYEVGEDCVACFDGHNAGSVLDDGFWDSNNWR